MSQIWLLPWVNVFNSVILKCKILYGCRTYKHCLHLNLKRKCEQENIWKSLTCRIYFRITLFLFDQILENEDLRFPIKQSQNPTNVIVTKIHSRLGLWFNWWIYTLCQYSLSLPTHPQPPQQVWGPWRIGGFLGGGICEWYMAFEKSRGISLDLEKFPQI